MRCFRKLTCAFLAVVMVLSIMPISALAETEEVPPCAEDSHIWDDGVRTEATEDASAFLTYTCTLCGQTKSETIAEEPPVEPEEKLPCEHSWDDGVSSETVIMYTCTLCGETKTEELPSVEEPTRCAENAHVWDDGVCSETVITYTCTVCGETKTENVQQPQSMVEGIAIDETNFPDQIFRNYVSQFDTDADGVLSESERMAVTAIAINNSGIYTLEGIEYFTELKELNCYGNHLSDLDVSKNTKLTDIDCSWNNLSSLDLSGKPAMGLVLCAENRYTLNLASGNSIDLSHLPGDFDVSRAADWSRGTVDGTILTLDVTEPCNMEVTYSYDVNGNGGWITFTLVVNRPHTPGDKITANYTECGGGAVTDYYHCEICGILCDENGTELRWDDVFKAGTEKHKADPKRVQGGNYTECGGGWMVPFTYCEVCDNHCTLSGGFLNYEEDYREGNDQHTPDINNKQKADYTECGGGYTVDWYSCKNCGHSCLGDGSPLNGRYYQEGTGIHTPNLNRAYKANYTECGGGWTVDRYSCEICNRECLSDGTVADYDQYYKEGNGLHTPNLDRVYKTDYTECGGGWIVDRYDCKICNRNCLADGTEEDWEQHYKEGTGKHTPDLSREREPDFTECGGGWTITRYPCKTCGNHCLLNGAEADYKTYYKEGNGRHTADLNKKHEPNYTECGGGYAVTYYDCEKCSHNCLRDGSELDYQKHYKQGDGKHTPGPENPPTFTECGGGITVPYHECIYCHALCDSSGSEFSGENYPWQPGSWKHTPGTIHAPTNNPCGVNVTVPYSFCVDCGAWCREDGNELQYPGDYVETAQKHTPGPIYKWDYNRCAGDNNIGYTDYAYCTICGQRCMPDGSGMDFGESGYSGHCDLDEDGVCDRGGEYIYAVIGGNIYLDPKTGYIRDCDNQVTVADIPAQIKGAKVSGITRYAFQYANKLQSVALPEGLTAVEYAAFTKCTQLQRISFPNTLTSIGEHAFYDCGLTGVVIPDGVSSLGSAAFSGCVDMESATIGTGVTSIGSIAFARCEQLGEIKFLGNAPSIAGNAFNSVTATVYYPGNNSTWTEAVRQNYGGTLTWVAYDTTDENTLVLDEAQFGSTSVIWIDGLQYIIKDSDRVDGKIYLDLPDTERKILTTHTYNTGSSNLHQVYPTGMKVWKLSNDGTSYTATELKEFANILQYCGSSIRMTGKKGIRMITGVPDGQRNSLISGNLAGYTLEEYGTVIGFANEVGDNLTLENGRSNYAYKRGVSDAVFAQSGGKTQYTNVLVGFTMEQCKEDIAMRPYIKVRDSEGNVSVIYGGIVYRSIGYIAWQNRDVYPQGSDGYNYIWDIINAVYGDNQPG